MTRKAQADFVAKLRDTAKVERMDQGAAETPKPDATVNPKPGRAAQEMTARRARLIGLSGPVTWPDCPRGQRHCAAAVFARSLPSRLQGDTERRHLSVAIPREVTAAHVHCRLPACPEPRSRDAGDRRCSPRDRGRRIRYKGRTDVLLAVLDKGTTVAGVFTRSSARRRRSNGAAPS